MLLWVHFHRNSSSIVLNCDIVSLLYENVDLIAESCHCFVHSVVNNFIYKLMQTKYSSRSNIHARPLANCIETLQYVNAGTSVFIYSLLQINIVVMFCWS